jgi:hypothetical protein
MKNVVSEWLGFPEAALLHPVDEWEILLVNRAD